MGGHSSFSHDYFYTIFIGVAALLVTKNDGDVAIVSARNALLIFVILSALCILIRPEMVLSRNYQGYIPGLRLRYAGLSNHANSFGPLVAVFLLCLWVRPFAVRSLNLFSWILGVFSLVLTQSKTSWIAFVFCSICLAYFGHREFLKQRLFDWRRPYILVSAISIMMLLMTAMTMTAMFGSVGDKVGAYFATRGGSDLLTMTGRDQIWDVAVQEWQKFPFFGYGLTIWDEAFRLKIGLPAAYHAHNQFFQVLSSAGLFGVFGLTVYVALLFSFTLRTAQSSQGLSLALFILIFMRAISEVPLAMQSFGPDQMVHLLLLMVIAANYSKQNSIKLVSGTYFHPGLMRCRGID
jgi:exopolysaccharide production protein ExoQ